MARFAPDVLVELTRVQNHRHKCEGRLFGDRKWRKCDLYIITEAWNRYGDGIAPDATMETPEAQRNDFLQVGRFPMDGDWGNLKQHSIVEPSNTRVYEGPAQDGIDIRVFAQDSDGSSKWATFGRVHGKIASAVCGAISYCGPETAISGDEAHQKVADAIENNEDDDMGSRIVRLRESKDDGDPGFWSYWGLDGKSSAWHRRYGEPIRVGDVTVWLKVTEDYWHNPIPLF